jgi:hypothetical protein
MDMVGHDTKGVQPKPKFAQSFFDSVKQHLTAFVVGEAKFAIVAANCDMVAVACGI